MPTRCGGGLARRSRPDYRCFSPPVDDLSAYDDLGQTPQGIPVRVFRPVARANLRILVGSVLPHLAGGLWRRLQVDFPGHEPSDDAGQAASPGNRRSIGTSRLTGRSLRRAMRCGRRFTRRQRSWGHAGRSAILPVVEGRFFGSSRGIPNGCRISWRKRQTTAAGTGGTAGGPCRGGERSLAGRPDAELQGVASSSRGLSIGRRAGRTVLD